MEEKQMYKHKKKQSTLYTDSTKTGHRRKQLRRGENNQ